jgi:hypothetical protein
MSDDREAPQAAPEGIDKKQANALHLPMLAEIVPQPRRHRFPVEDCPGLVPFAHNRDRPCSRVDVA